MVTKESLKEFGQNYKVPLAVAGVAMVGFGFGSLTGGVSKDIEAFTTVLRDPAIRFVEAGVGFLGAAGATAYGAIEAMKPKGEELNKRYLKAAGVTLLVSVPLALTGLYPDGLVSAATNLANTLKDTTLDITIGGVGLAMEGVVFNKQVVRIASVIGRGLSGAKLILTSLTQGKSEGESPAAEAGPA
jgi:hypothetical protein